MASGTALIYDGEMMSHKLLWEDTECDIEVPERLSASYEQLRQYNLVERCVRVPVREATVDEITLVHSQEYLEVIKSTQSMNEDELRNTSMNYDCVFLHPNSYRCAKLAAGGTLQLVDSVMSGKVLNGMALVRPPGHHSQRNLANGFCLFNNVAIAAEYAKKKYNLQRILIVDWDIHHGQGIQYIFEEDPSVLYFSWHLYQHQEFWPKLRESDFDAVGKGDGTGFNINVPWNKVGMENADYIAAFLHVLLPIAFEFNPELILISSGYDSAIGDPEGKMCATPECYAHLTHFLMQLANGKCCVVLEGGYHMRSLSESVCMTVKTLLGDPVPQLHGEMVPCFSAVETIQNVRAAHKPYWKCLAFSGSSIVQAANTRRQGSGEAATPAKTNSEVAIETDIFLQSHMKSFLFPAPPVIAAAVVSENNTLLLPKCMLVHEDTVPAKEAQAHLSFHKELMEDEIDTYLLTKTLSLLNTILQKQVRSGISECLSASAAAVVALKHCIRFGLNRVLHIMFGDVGGIHLNEEGKIISIRISENQPSQTANSKYEISLNWKEDLQTDDNFVYTLLSLILPLAYSFQPELTVITFGPESKITISSIALLTKLMQGLGEGGILALIQDTELKYLKTVAEALLGVNTPAIAPNSAAAEVVIQAVEEQRHNLQTEWKMLRCSVD
ncbi:polyamine deacetylase HDAC10 [Ambystoma mexicanum]|uniref:polyamine deacetylase HDAC10 n=1 Tax=Ambystoma mexicanum TaxID=8296 RepID=UPI0037E88FB5